MMPGASSETRDLEYLPRPFTILPAAGEPPIREVAGPPVRGPVQRRRPGELVRPDRVRRRRKSAPTPDDSVATVERVVDGDTLDATIAGSPRGCGC